tara:strand:+ start:5966 stop:6742 length:777 start_codon:yes stop_codon:yes gene_type:complete
MKTVIDAVNELNGDLENTHEYDYEKYLSFCHWTGVWVTTDTNELSETHWEVCTSEEFLAIVVECETNFGKCTAEDYFVWIALKDNKPTKELDMDIDWSTTEYNFALVNSLNNIVEFLEFKPRLTDDNECYTTNVTEKLYYVGPWAVAERSQPILPTLTYTQAMYDNGVQVESGMRFATEAGEYIAEYTNKKSVCFTDENGFLVTVTRGHARPIDIRTDTEKAIDSLDDFNLCICNGWQEDVIGFIKSGEFHGVKWVGE